MFADYRMKKNLQNKPLAKKNFGQNFLTDQNYVRKIIGSVNPQKDETIIEIGPGRGALTKDLLEKAAAVVAIELDADLILVLNEEFGEHANFLLVHRDILQVDLKDLVRNYAQNPKKAKLAGNLPYNISTAILQRLIDFRESFSEMIIMLQKEVAERITSEPGKRERGYLTVLTEAFFEAVKLFDVPPQAFRPVPKVQSSVIRLKPKKIDFPVDESFFKKMIGIGFRQKRKTVFNNFKGLMETRELSEIFETAQINPQKRAENLLLEEWISLARCLRSSLNTEM